MKDFFFDNSWLRKDGKPTLISGPCSAETQEQVLATATELAKDPRVDFFRAGIWKPRTRPGSFEGAGREALKWLKLVKKECGLPVATEVANTSHVEEALAHDIDLLWIGARTSVNPFAVDELAQALKGSGKIVLLKNPINPDVSLWIGGIERLLKVGLTRVGAIHRGFSTFKSSVYRNPPMWKIPIELKRKFPQIPIFSDPSHIMGKREGLQMIAQDALNLNFEGLMIESHPNPEEAWSDASQQLTPVALTALLDDLTLFRENIKGSFEGELTLLRRQIDQCDLDILADIVQRMEIVQNIATLKYEHKVSVLQSNRWTEILKKMKEKAEQMGLSKDFIARIFKEIHQESVIYQNRYFDRVQSRGKT